MKTKKFISSFLFSLMMVSVMLGGVSCTKPESGSSESSGTASSSAGETSSASGTDADGTTAAGPDIFVTTRPGETTVTTGAGSTSTTVKSKIDPYKNIPARLKGKTVKLLLWYAPTKEEKECWDAFTKKTGIKWKAYSSGTTHMYDTKLASMVNSQDGLDICVMSSSGFPIRITKNLVQPIDAGKFNMNDPAWSKDIMNMFKWGGKYYGVNIKGNWHSDPVLLYYNKTMFDSRGVKTPDKLWKEGNWNWDTFLATAQKMTYTSNGKNIYGFACAKQYLFMQSMGADFLKFSGSRIINNVNDPKVLKAWQFRADLVNRYKVDPGYKDYSFFSSGQCAMYGEINYGLGTNSWWKNMTDEWGFVPFPSPKGQKLILPSDEKVYSLVRGSENPEAAAYFLRWWLDPANTDMSKTFLNKECENMFNWLVDQPRSPIRSVGVVSHTNNFNNLTNALYTYPSDQTQWVLSTWGGRFDACIESVMNEMG